MPSLPLQAVDWTAAPNPEAPVNNYMIKLVEETTMLHKVLSRYLPSSIVEVRLHSLILSEFSIRFLLQSFLLPRLSYTGMGHKFSCGHYILCLLLQYGKLRASRLPCLYIAADKWCAPRHLIRHSTHSTFVLPPMTLTLIFSAIPFHSSSCQKFLRRSTIACLGNSGTLSYQTSKPRIGEWSCYVAIAPPPRLFLGTRQ